MDLRNFDRGKEIPLADKLQIRCIRQGDTKNDSQVSGLYNYMDSETENTKRTRHVERQDLAWGLFNLPWRLPQGNIKSRVGSVGQEFKGEAEGGDGHIHVPHRELKLWVRT